MFADVLNSCVLNELTPVSGRLLALVKHKWPFHGEGRRGKLLWTLLMQLSPLWISLNVNELLNSLFNYPAGT